MHNLAGLWRSLLYSVIATFFSFLSYLTGSTRCNGIILKDQTEFRATANSITDTDALMFSRALHAQLSGENRLARESYADLLSRYPNNSVILHNLRAIR